MCGKHPICQDNFFLDTFYVGHIKWVSKVLGNFWIKLRSSVTKNKSVVNCSLHQWINIDYIKSHYANFLQLYTQITWSDNQLTERPTFISENTLKNRI
jgi:hypothetical protein